VTIEGRRTTSDFSHSENSFGFTIDNEDVFGREFVGVFWVGKEVGMNGSSNGESKSFFIFDGFFF